MSDEKSIRRDIILTARQMSIAGLGAGRSGNVSARWRAGFLITPSGLAYDGLEPGDIVFVDENGQARGRHAPSSEWRFHHDIYRAFKPHGAIVHCHSRHATALACQGLEIPAFHYMVAVAGGARIPLAEYALFGTQDLSDHILAALSQGFRAALLRHHGQVACGRDLSAALELAMDVEELAAQYILVRGLGDVLLLSEDQMREVIDRFAGYGANAAAAHRRREGAD